MNEEDFEFDDEGSVKDQSKRYAHTAAEQKRRDAIKRGYNYLMSIVPGCGQQENISGAQQKVSRAQVLNRSIEYIQYLLTQKKSQEEQLEALEREIEALKIMKSNYEVILKASQQEALSAYEVPDETKFGLFRLIMDSLWESFRSAVSVTSFEVLSATVFSWLEEHCKPQSLKETVIHALQTLFGRRQ